MGVAQNLTAGVAQVLGFVSIYQAAILAHVLDPSHVLHSLRLCPSFHVHLLSLAPTPDISTGRDSQFARKTQSRFIVLVLDYNTNTWANKQAPLMRVAFAHAQAVFTVTDK